MAFDTFDEGIAPGGLRSKTEIKILICYLFYSVNKCMDKDLIINAIQSESLANYFETTSAFDDLVEHGNLKLCSNSSENSEELFELTENGRLIATQLETTVAYSVREKAYACALKLLSKKQVERDNSVKIEEIDNGYNVLFNISGGTSSLFEFKMYAPTYEQASMMKKNFYNAPPSLIYKIMLALLTSDKEYVGQALEELYGIL